MARKLTVGEATVHDIAALPYWNDLAGVVDTGSEMIEALIAARRRGVLGVATAGKGLRDRLEILYKLSRDDWYCACTVVLSVRLDDEQVGMLHAGAHHRLWKFLGEAYYGPALHDTVDPAEFQRREGGYLATVLTVAKLHMVAVSPDHRGRGHGRRLVNHALNRLTRGGTGFVYGQFGGDRDLRGFYESLGFDVLGRGEALNMAAATGIAGFGLQAQPEDTLFARAHPPAAPPVGAILG